MTREARRYGNKSTNVRFAAIGAAVRALELLHPPSAGRAATRLFLSTQRNRRPAREQALLAEAEPLTLAHEGKRLAGWSWGAEGPTVLLVHGWNGRGGQLGSFVEPLRARGHRVVAFDTVGHGDSDGDRTTIAEMAGAVASVARAVGPVEAVVAHSLGGPAAALAVSRGLPVRRLAFLGSPIDPSVWIDWFAERLSLSKELRDRLAEGVASANGVSLEDLTVLSFAPRMRTPLLIAHDRDDLEVPWEAGKVLSRAWPGARLMMTEGLGHRRILRDPEVVEEVTKFVVAPTPLRLAEIGASA